MTGARRAAQSVADFHALVGETSQDALLLQQHFSEHWDGLLRLSGSLKVGIGKLLLSSGGSTRRFHTLTYILHR